MDTRGLRHLKSYLGKEGEKLAKAKQAKHVVPVLASRQGAAALAANGTDSTVSTKVQGSLSSSVMTYLEGRLSSGATTRLSRTQMTLVAALAAPGSSCSSSRTEDPKTGEKALAVTRAKVVDMKAAVDTLALSALELAARRATEYNTSCNTTGEGAHLFVLVDTNREAVGVTEDLKGRYGLTVLLLSDDSACRYPSFPCIGNGASGGDNSKKKTSASETPSGRRRRTQSNSLKGNEAPPKNESAEEPSALTGVVVVVATPAAFLAVDRRSAIWKFIGSCALLLRHAPAHSGSLLYTLKGNHTASSLSTNVSPLALNAQRWSCLSHVAAIAVLAADQSWLTEPELDLLTTLRIESGSGKSEGGVSKPTAAAVSHAVATLRSPVTVHYAVAQGTHRFQFLFALLKGLAPNRGIVVHVATRECVTFLYDTLYSFLGELPPYIELLSDYEGASAYTNMHTSADRERLCVAFDSTVESGKGGKTAAVLLSCHGLVPRRGSVFLQYDIIPDILNYNQFIADVLTPSAIGANMSDGKEGTLSSLASELVVRRERTARQRKRSTSPPPAPAAAKRVSRDGTVSTDTEAHSPNIKAGSFAGVNYTHILLLLRPNEVTGALRHLRQEGASRYRLEFRELNAQAGGRHHLVGEKLKSMNKKLFAVQNAAYYAYKATMRVYSTIGPRDVYDETRVNLEKVAEEFGYTELPLLDLRLKDTVFRPKEDYYRAARQKQDAERRAYKAFAKENIIGEVPEEHVADNVA
ncbi:hypothetical protein JKF63_03833 [Porcisia hertigi]|uniref:Uncharacterized protein n=1 Tax=Porcisia hertigi TaxID=2761500 RepID=A0A836L445_9TRYP|nr:hypothetical protein JKF63_03833 [Porcisia hertigi]